VVIFFLCGVNVYSIKPFLINDGVRLFCMFKKEKKNMDYKFAITWLEFICFEDQVMTVVAPSIYM
jgi:hypothetical protein